MNSAVWLNLTRAQFYWLIYGHVAVATRWPKKDFHAQKFERSSVVVLEMFSDLIYRVFSLKAGVVSENKTFAVHA